MKSIREKYFPLEFYDYESTLKRLNLVNSECFNNSLHIEYKHMNEIKINNGEINTLSEAIDHLDRLYHLQDIKNKIDRINEIN